MNKKIVIIGAGISGLAAGWYARMNGYSAEIYESHAIPGGLCTSWKKGEYTFDGCLHWLTGSSSADNFFLLWQELGAIQGSVIHNHEEFYRFTSQEGKTLILYTNIDRLEKHLLEFSPADHEIIKKLCDLIRKFSKFKAPIDKAYELFNFFDIARMIWRMRSFMKDFKYCNSISIGEFAEGFKDNFLREVFPIALGSGEMSMLGFIVTMALLNNNAGGYPKGGSLKFAKTIEKRFIDLGGKILYGRKVAKIIVENGKACAIQLVKGEVISADYVISSSDLHSTIYNMLDARFIEPQHEELFQKAELYPSSVQVSFGVNMNFSNEPDCVAWNYKLESPLIIGNQKNEWLMIRNYNFDETLAPKGKTIVECLLHIKDFDFWEALYSDKPAYKSEKERIGRKVAEEIEKRYPGFTASIEEMDVATPMTYVRYTGNYRGAYMTWIMTPRLMKEHQIIKKSITGVQNFWLAGMWTMAPGGVPTAAKSSRDVIQLICSKDKRKFRTIIPE